MRKYYRLSDLLPGYNRERDWFNIYLKRYKIETNFKMIKEINIKLTRVTTLDDWERIITEMYKKSKPHSRTIRRLLVTMYDNLEKIREKQSKLDSENTQKLKS